MSVVKKISLRSERTRLEWRADFINALSHTNFFFSQGNTGRSVYTISTPQFVPAAAFGKLNQNAFIAGRVIELTGETGLVRCWYEVEPGRTQYLLFLRLCANVLLVFSTGARCPLSPSLR